MGISSRNSFTTGQVMVAGCGYLANIINARKTCGEINVVLFKKILFCLF